MFNGKPFFFALPERVFTYCLYFTSGCLNYLALAGAAGAAGVAGVAAGAAVVFSALASFLVCFTALCLAACSAFGAAVAAAGVAAAGFAVAGAAGAPV